MVSVSELKKQSQIGVAEEAIGTGEQNFEGAGPEELLPVRGHEEKKDSPQGSESRGPSRGALRGTAYHAALERLSFQDIHSREDTEKALERLLESGFLDQESFGFINPSVVWTFLSGPLGRRMAKAQAEADAGRNSSLLWEFPPRRWGKGTRKNWC